MFAFTSDTSIKEDTITWINYKCSSTTQENTFDYLRYNMTLFQISLMEVDHPTASETSQSGILLIYQDSILSVQRLNSWIIQVREAGLIKRSQGCMEKVHELI